MLCLPSFVFSCWKIKEGETFLSRRTRDERTSDGSYSNRRRGHVAHDSTDPASRSQPNLRNQHRMDFHGGLHTLRGLGHRNGHARQSKPNMTPKLLPPLVRGPLDVSNRSLLVPFCPLPCYNLPHESQNPRKIRRT